MSSDPLRDLLASPGVREVSRLEGRVGFMAYHGGSLEQYTDVIADEAAARCGASYYGVLQPPDLQWHIPSTKVRPEESERLAENQYRVVTLAGHELIERRDPGAGQRRQRGHRFFVLMRLGEAEQRRLAHRVTAGQHQRPAHRDLYAPAFDVVRPNRKQRAGDAAMLRQIIRHVGLAVRSKVRGRGTRHPLPAIQFPRHIARIADFAHLHRKIEPAFDQIHLPVVDADIKYDVGIAPVKFLRARQKR